MIFAFTGQPGAGKTLGAVEFVYTDKQFEGRPVYVYGVKGLNVPDWEVIDHDQVMRWWELPEGSVIIIDECQDIWRPRGQGKAVPEHVEKLEKHRHLGMDFVLTFQFPTQIDTVVRNLITDHFHSHRVMGINGRTVFHFDYLCLEPLSKAKQKTATRSIRPFNKKIYDLYTSASLHTAKPRIPKYVYLFPVLIIIGCTALYYVYTSLVKPQMEGTLVNSGTSITGTGESGKNFTTSNDRGFKVVTAEDYVKQRVPLLKNDHWSLPIYANLLEAKTLPKTFCIQSNAFRNNRENCRCYTQQATWIKAIDVQQCQNYIRDGYRFDYTVQENQRGEESEERAQRGSPFPLVENEPINISAPKRIESTMRHPALN